MIHHYPELGPAQVQALGHVRRWHTRRMSREQNLLEHGAGVALLALHLAGGTLCPTDERDLLRLALLHDAHETEFGDLPYPSKRLLEAKGIHLDADARKSFWGGLDPYQAVSPQVLDYLEVADVLDAALTAQDAGQEGLAAAVADQAVAEVNARFTGRVVARVMEALGIWIGATL